MRRRAQGKRVQTTAEQIVAYGGNKRTFRGLHCKHDLEHSRSPVQGLLYLAHVEPHAGLCSTLYLFC